MFLTTFIPAIRQEQIVIYPPFGDLVLGSRERLREQALPDGFKLSLIQEAVNGRLECAVVDCHSMRTSVELKVTLHRVNSTWKRRIQLTWSLHYILIK